MLYCVPQDILGYGRIPEFGSVWFTGQIKVWLYDTYQSGATSYWGRIRFPWGLTRCCIVSTLIFMLLLRIYYNISSCLYRHLSSLNVTKIVRTACPAESLHFRCKGDATTTSSYFCVRQGDFQDEPFPYPPMSDTAPPPQNNSFLAAVAFSMWREAS